MTKIKTEQETTTKQPAVEEQPKQTAEDLSTKFYDVELPSKGKVGYPETVQYRDILVRDEKILASATEATYSNTLNKVLKSLLGDVAWFDDITLHDRDFLLLWIWANNYTSVKEVQVVCRECDHNNDVSIDLTQLDIKDISEEYVHPFKVKLSDDTVIDVHLLTISDQSAADKFMKAQEANKRLKDEEKFDYETVLMAVSMDLETVMPLENKLKWIQDNIRGKDMARVRYVHEYFKYGVKDTMDHTCSNCGEAFKFRIPFRPEWLRPSVQDDFEEMLRFNKTS